MSELVIKPDWPVPDHVKAFTTTRLGGNSKGAYQSLNLGNHVDDEPQKVRQNRDWLESHYSLPESPLWLTQTHSDRVINLDQSLNSDIADGSYSSTSDKVCVVMTADCLPLFLSNQTGTEVAVLHVGWRGLVGGIIEAGLAMFTSTRESIFAWAGPSIGPDAFEVGEELCTQLGGDEQCYRPSPHSGKVLANLYRLTELRLAAAGVHHYGHYQGCTYQERDRFFSYRRDGETGRMASLIWIAR